MTDTPKTLLSRQWSASSLLRGNSYLQEQQEKNKKLTFDDVMKASWLKLFRYHRTPVVFWCHFWHQSLPHRLPKVAQQKLQALQGNATPQRKQLFSPSDADRTMFYPPPTQVSVNSSPAAPASSGAQKRGKITSDQKDCSMVSQTPVWLYVNILYIYAHSFYQDLSHHHDYIIFLYVNICVCCISIYLYV